jgi:hypothetical protein
MGVIVTGDHLVLRQSLEGPHPEPPNIVCVVRHEDSSHPGCLLICVRSHDEVRATTLQRQQILSVEFAFAAEVA